MEKLTGVNKLVIDDPLSALVERLIRTEADAENVDVDGGSETSDRGSSISDPR